jgi:hypothetical protein
VILSFRLIQPPPTKRNRCGAPSLIIAIASSVGTPALANVSRHSPTKRWFEASISSCERLSAPQK